MLLEVQKFKSMVLGFGDGLCALLCADKSYRTHPFYQVSGTFSLITNSSPHHGIKLSMRVEPSRLNYQLEVVPVYNAKIAINCNLNLGGDIQTPLDSSCLDTDIEKLHIKTRSEKTFISC